jgi:hypothetical protein
MIRMPKVIRMGIPVNARVTSIGILPNCYASEIVQITKIPKVIRMGTMQLNVYALQTIFGVLP